MTVADFVLRKEERTGLSYIEDCVDASIQRLEDYMEERSRGLVTATGNNTDNTRINTQEITRK